VLAISLLDNMRGRVSKRSMGQAMLRPIRKLRPSSRVPHLWCLGPCQSHQSQ